MQLSSRAGLSPADVTALEQSRYFVEELQECSLKDLTFLMASNNYSKPAVLRVFSVIDWVFLM